MVAPSPATDILFNEAALSSLKRAQLMQLCKMHGVKANGKNVEMVQRLREYAEGVPPPVTDAPTPTPATDDMDIADEDEQETGLVGPAEEYMDTAIDVDFRDGGRDTDLPPSPETRKPGQRPSEVWEVIEEETMKEMKDLEENYKATTKGSSKSSKWSGSGTGSSTRSKMPGEFGLGSGKESSVGSGLTRGSMFGIDEFTTR
jgi:hypothetical protein